MLSDLKTLALEAQNKGYAIGAFNTPDFECINAVISAAEELDTPVIIMHAEIHNHIMPLEYIGPSMISRAKSASVPVGVHFDHGMSFDMIVKAMRMGYTSVMYDGSGLPYDENIANTKEIVKIAHAMGIYVEAELGEVQKGEIGSGTTKKGHSLGRYTDPEQALNFAEITDADALAISFGNAHGIYRHAPKLDFERIARIKKLVKIPLVMHGGSGMSPEQYLDAIHNGIAKINYYTYMAKAGAEFLRKCFLEDKVFFFHEAAEFATKAMKENVKTALKIFMNKK